MTPAIRTILLGQRPWSFRDWFRSGEQGAVYEADNPADGGPVTAYVENTGITPVTAPGQGAADCVIGFLKDKRLGDERGPELFSDGELSAATGWTLENGWSVSGGKLRYAVTGTGRDAHKAVTTTAGRWYEVTFTIDSMSAGQLGAYSLESSNATSAAFSASIGARRYLFAATGASMSIRIRTSAAGSGDIVIDNISVRELPGNHATQATTASKPVLTARYNLLTQTEAFDNAAWTKSNLTIAADATTAPTGTTTADKLVETAVSAAHVATHTFSSSAASYTARIAFKAAERSIGYIRFYDGSSGLGYATYFNLGTGAVGTSDAGNTATIQDIGGGWFLCSVARTMGASAGSQAQIGTAAVDGTISFLGDITKGIYVWGADLRTSADAALSIPAYQRVTDASNYDTAGFKEYDKLDGLDDGVASATGGGGSAGFFWCGAVRVIGGAGASRSIWSDVGTNTGYRVRLTSTNKLALGAGDNVAFTSATTAEDAAVGSTYVLTVWDDGTNLNAQINLGTVAQAARPVVVAGPGTFSLGKDNNAATAFANVGIYAQVYKKDGGISASARAKCQRWVAAQAGLTI
jgi:hypothetical protein